MKGMMLAGFMMWSLLTPVKADEFLSILVGGGAGRICEIPAPWNASLST